MDVLVRVLVEHVGTLLTVAPHRVVLTVQTHPSTDPSVRLVHGRVKLTPVRVTVAVALWEELSFIQYSTARNAHCLI